MRLPSEVKTWSSPSLHRINGLFVPHYVTPSYCTCMQASSTSPALSMSLSKRRRLGIFQGRFHLVSLALLVLRRLEIFLQVTLPVPQLCAPKGHCDGMWGSAVLMPGRSFQICF